ncbi:MAG: hypothetical protein DRG35_01395 [Deltaproteobacteria bacterium]|nr:MAG: hypothetical protein DRG35_01395 [Deltaproteobacteria bacterium]
MVRTKRVRSKRKATTRKTIPAVFAVHGSETIDGKHVVYYSASGDLNKGRKKKFTNWREAVKFAREKAKQWGIKADISKH